MNKIDPSILYALICHIPNKPPFLDTTEWKIVNEEIISSDDEDGGGEYDIVLEHIPTGKFYQTSYCDWDIDNTDFNYNTNKVDGRCDLNCDLLEVVPIQVVKTIYSIVKK